MCVDEVCYFARPDPVVLPLFQIVQIVTPLFQIGQ